MFCALRSAGDTVTGFTLFVSAMAANVLRAHVGGSLVFLPGYKIYCLCMKGFYGERLRTICNVHGSGGGPPGRVRGYSAHSSGGAGPLRASKEKRWTRGRSAQPI